MTYLEGTNMKKTALILSAIILSAGVALAFPETSSFNTQEMQRIQNFQYNTRNDYDNVSNFKARKKDRQEKAKQLEERQKNLEQRAQQSVSPNAQFVNENGVLKIERR